MGRAPCCEKVGLRRGRWTAEEDNILTKYIQANGEGRWRTLPKNAGLLRCGKSCRLRWINYLRADLKRGNITPEEEKIILNLHSSYGNRWSFIAGHLPGRTDNEIKNYWNTRLSRKHYSFPRAIKESLPTAISKAVVGKRRGERVRARRSAMKKLKNAASGTLEMSLVKPESVTPSKMVEATSEEKARLLERIPITVMTSRSPERKVDTRSHCMHGSCLDGAAMILEHCEESKCVGLSPDKEGAISAFLFCPVQKRENDALGPYEWLDCEMTRLNDILQSRVEDPSGGVDHKERRENGVVGINERANAGLGTEKETVNEGESSVLSSNADGDLHNCSSSTASRIDDEWFDWDWVDGVECHDQLNVWNEEEQMFTYSWGAGKGDNE